MEQFVSTVKSATNCIKLKMPKNYSRPPDGYSLKIAYFASGYLVYKCLNFMRMVFYNISNL